MELLQQNVVIMDNRKTNPQNRPVVGDVARLDCGRVVARYRLDFRDGTSAWACGDYALNEKAPALRNIASPKDWTAWITAEIEKGQGSYRRLGPHEFAPPEEIEFAAFRAAYPHVATFLHLPTSPPSEPLFDVGRVDLPRHPHDVDWRQLLRTHESGDFGVYGKYAGEPLTDEKLWTLAMQPVLTGNTAAIASKSGPIRSRYRLSAFRVVTVVTVLSPGGARTLITAAGAGNDLAGHP